MPDYSCLVQLDTLSNKPIYILQSKFQTSLTNGVFQITIVNRLLSEKNVNTAPLGNFSLKILNLFQTTFVLFVPVCIHLVFKLKYKNKSLKGLSETLNKTTACSDCLWDSMAL